MVRRLPKVSVCLFAAIMLVLLPFIIWVSFSTWQFTTSAALGIKDVTLFAPATFTMLGGATFSAIQKTTINGEIYMHSHEALKGQ